MTKYIEIKGHSIQTTDTDPEAYAGTWASSSDMNTGRASLSSVGTQTASLGAGGTSDTDYEAKVETYDGSSWTEVADLKYS